MIQIFVGIAPCNCRANTAPDPEDGCIFVSVAGFPRLPKKNHKEKLSLLPFRRKTTNQD